MCYSVMARCDLTAIWYYITNKYVNLYMYVEHIVVLTCDLSKLIFTQIFVLLQTLQIVHY